MKYLKILISGFLAGAIVGLAGLAFLMAGKGPLGAAIFPFGLYFICLLQATLYTGKIGRVMDRQYNIWQWLLMLLGNLLGAGLFGLLCHWLVPGLTIERALNYTFGEIAGLLAQAIMCGALVHLAITLYQKGTDGFTKFLGIFSPIFIFVLCGYRHCIADTFYFGYLLKFDLTTFISLLIVIIGNSAGAIGFEYLTRMLAPKDQTIS